MAGLIPKGRGGWLNAISRPLIYFPPLLGIATSFTGKYRAMEIGSWFVMESGLLLITIALIGFLLGLKEGFLAKLALGLFYLLIGPAVMPAMG
jgi:thiamine transporter ThiT